MRKTFASEIFALTISLIMFVGAANAQLLDDGGFALPTHQSDVSNSNWVLTANSPDGTDLSTRFQVSGFSRSDGAVGSGAGVWYRSFEGAQGGSSEPLAESTLSQSVAAPQSGDYVLSVDWAREVDFTADSWGVTLSSSGSGGSTTVDLLNATSIANGNFNQLLTGNADPTGTTGPNVANLTLTGVTAGDNLTVTAFMTGGTDVGGSQSAFLDNFNLSLVPEPGAGLMTLLGAFGVLGMIRRRR